MNLQSHIFSSIESLERNKVDEALMHACFAVDATTRNLFGKTGAKNYKACLRQHSWIIERFMAAGINIENTKWTNIEIDNGYGEKISNPDLADIIYHVFRCNHAHAQEIPIEFELLPRTLDSSKWIIGLQDARVHMPDSVIIGLLALSVFSKANWDIKTESEHFLTWQSPKPTSDFFKFPIKYWWGKESELKKLFAHYPLHSHIFNF